MNYKTI